MTRTVSSDKTGGIKRNGPSSSAKSRRTDEKFLEELRELIMAQGISDLTIGEMAARLHCSRRRIYEIGATKEEVFLAVSKDIFSIQIAEGLAAARREDNPVAAISAYLGTSAIISARLSMAYLTDLEATPKARRLFDDYQAARARGLEDLVGDGVRQGLFAPHHSRVVAEALLGAALRIRQPRFLAENGLTMEAAFSELYELVLHGLIHRSGGHPSHGIAEEAASRTIESAGLGKSLIADDEARYRIVDQLSERQGMTPATGHHRKSE